jgi:hypothetical protein
LERISHQQTQLIATDQFKLLGALRERQRAFIEHAACDKDAASGAVGGHDSKQLSKGTFADPAVSPVLALNDPAAIVFPHDEVDPAVGDIAAPRLDRVTLRLIDGGNEILELAPRHGLDIPHRLVKLEQPKAATTNKGCTHCLDGSYVQRHASQNPSDRNPLSVEVD